MANFISFVGLFIILPLLINGCCFYTYASYPSIISFGNSYTDTGNLKRLAAIFNQSFNNTFNVLVPPYGQNLPDQSTGRASNGLLIIDFLAESLGLPLIPPFLNNNGIDNSVAFQQGVNYAVSGATALDTSFLESIGIVNPLTNASLGVELAWFKYSLPSICGNASECRKFIRRSLILMGEIGVNDYNYAVLAGKRFEEIEALVPLVVDSIISAVKELIEKRAQTLVVPGNFPIGCYPLYLTFYSYAKEEYDPTTGCLVRFNNFTEYHNKLLITELNQIRDLYPSVNIIYADYYNAAMKLYRSPDKFGFANGDLKACCGAGGPYNFDLFVLCGAASATVCDQPDTYISWDGLHLTEAAYKQIFSEVFQGSYATPHFNSLCNTSNITTGSRII